MKKNKTGYKAVIVTWGDAWSQGGWVTKEPDCTPIMVQTLGFLGKRNSKGIVLFGRVAEDGVPGVTNFIPTGMIKSIKAVK